MNTNERCGCMQPCMQPATQTPPCGQYESCCTVVERPQFCGKQQHHFHKVNHVMPVIIKNDIFSHTQHEYIVDTKEYDEAFAYDEYLGTVGQYAYMGQQAPMMAQPQMMNQMPMMGQAQMMNQMPMMAQPQMVNQMPLTQTQAMNQMPLTQTQAMNQMPFAQTQAMNQMPFAQTQAVNQMPFAQTQAVNQMPMTQTVGLKGGAGAQQMTKMNCKCACKY